MLKTRRIAAAVLFTFLPATVALPVGAQEDPATLQARARFKEGVEAFDKGKYEEARLAFLQAYTLRRHPAVLLNLAQSSAKANHSLEAAKYFHQFLKEASSATPQQRKDAEAGLAEVRQKLGRIDVIAPAGTEILLDDVNVGTTPLDPIDVEPGQHTIKSSTQSVVVTAGAGQKVEAKLGAAAVVSAAPESAHEAETAEVAEPTGTPEPAPERDTGTKRKTNLFTPPENMAPVYVGLGVAGAGVVSAVVFALFKADAQSKADKITTDIRNTARARGLATTGVCNNANAPEFAGACKTLRDNNGKVDTNATIANISLAVVGAGLLFAGVWYLAGSKAADGVPASASRAQRRPTAPLLTPYAGWESAGLTLSGEF